MNADTFAGYCYPKEESGEFCRQNGLRMSGGKPELTERVYKFLLTGERSSEYAQRPKFAAAEITEDTVIGPNIRYPQRLRDFFSDNEGRTLKDAIKCWNYKKGLPGNTRYERSDLEALL